MEQWVPGTRLSVKEAAEEIGVGESTIKRARAVIESGTEELQGEVLSGGLSVKQAARIAQLPADDQSAAIEQAKSPKPKVNKGPRDPLPEPEPHPFDKSDDDWEAEYQARIKELEAQVLELTRALEQATSVDTAEQIAGLHKRIADADRKQGEAMDRAAGYQRELEGFGNFYANLRKVLRVDSKAAVLKRVKELAHQEAIDTDDEVL
jgi:ribosomal protein L7/L12